MRAGRLFLPSIALVGTLMFAAACGDGDTTDSGGVDSNNDGDMTHSDASPGIECSPQCDGVECGDDGCGGTCGACPEAAPLCQDGLCLPECLPGCGGKECGDDGCGGTCGACPEAAPLCQDGLCLPECIPGCSDKVCGDDGCEGSCGTCGEPSTCVDGQCVCPPTCAGNECGDDGCGGSCGECIPGTMCNEEGMCQTNCDWWCQDKECGNPQGDCECGICEGCGVECADGLCVFAGCKGKQCGGDGCGGSCGECGEGSLCAEGVCIDIAGPKLAVTFPPRGATLDGDMMIPLEGEVNDELSGVQSLLVNDTVVAVGEDGSFSHMVEADYGLNLLVLEAFDGLSNETRVVQSFYYSTDYADFETGNMEDVNLEQALIVFLGQEFTDDGDHNPEEVNDLATLFEMLLEGLELDLLVGGNVPLADVIIPGLVDFVLNVDGFEVSISGDLGIKAAIVEASFSSPEVSVDTRDGGIAVSVKFSGPPEDPGIGFQVELALEFMLTLSWTLGGDELFQAPAYSGTVVQLAGFMETLSVTADIDINKEAGEELLYNVANLEATVVGVHLEPMGDLTVALGSVALNGETLDLPDVPLDLLAPAVDEICLDYALDPVINFLIPLALDVLEPVIGVQMPQVISSLLNSLAVGKTLTLPQFPGSDKTVEVEFESTLTTVSFSQAGGEATLAAGFKSPKAVDTDTLGSILRAGCLAGQYGTPEFDSEEAMEVAAKLDLTNELIFSTWWNDGLSLSLDSSALESIGLDTLDQLGIEDLGVQTEFWLPPILSSCPAQQPLQLQVGDLLITATFAYMNAPYAITAFISLSAEVVPDGQGSGPALTVVGITDIGTQLVSVEGDVDLLSQTIDIEELLANVLAPMLLETVTNLSLGSLPLPEIDMASCCPYIAPGTVLSLDSTAIDVTGEYLLFSGELQ